MNLDTVTALWADHMNEPFPDGLRWIDAPSGESIPALDSFIAGCVTTYLSNQDALDPQRQQVLSDCAAELIAALPSVPEDDVPYVARLIQIAELVTGRPEPASGPASCSSSSLGEAAPMSNSQGLRPAPEIRDYLVDQLNLTLRRPGMYGGETAIRLVVDHLEYAEHRDGAGLRRLLEERGAWTPRGVTGAFAQVIPGDYDSGIASVYAEYTQAQGWLKIDRALTAAEYSALATEHRRWTAQDRSLTDVLETFGPPSILFGGTNPLYGKTLSYTSGAPTDPVISFHLWNGTEPDAESSWPPLYNEPVLLVARSSTQTFETSLAFTPEGTLRRPS
jgi:hypothetical protein